MQKGTPAFPHLRRIFFFHFFVRCFLAFFFYRFFPYFSHGFKQFSPSLATVGFVETQNAKKVWNKCKKGWKQRPPSFRIFVFFHVYTFLFAYVSHFFCFVFFIFFRCLIFPIAFFRIFFDAIRVFLFFCACIILMFPVEACTQYVMLGLIQTASVSWLFLVAVQWCSAIWQAMTSRMAVASADGRRSCTTTAVDQLDCQLWAMTVNCKLV